MARRIDRLATDGAGGGGADPDFIMQMGIRVWRDIAGSFDDADLVSSGDFIKNL